MKKKGTGTETSYDLKTRYLEVIIALLLQSKDYSKRQNWTDQMELLDSLGLETGAIACILGRDPTQVSKDLYKIRNKKKGQEDGEQQQPT